MELHLDKYSAHARACTIEHYQFTFAKSIKRSIYDVEYNCRIGYVNKDWFKEKRIFKMTF